MNKTERNYRRVSYDCCINCKHVDIATLRDKITCYCELEHTWGCHPVSEIGICDKYEYRGY